jgi:zinc D-Ala-D-Ala carboxypeptidase
MKISKNFTLDELCVTNVDAPNVPDAEASGNLCTLVYHILQPLRDALGRPVRVNSAYRSPQVNKIVGGVGNSQHALGQAADITVDGMDPLELAKFIRKLELPYDQLIREPTWVHVSYGPRQRRICLTMRDRKYYPGLL